MQWRKTMEKKINTILACIDFSEYSQMVLDYAVLLAGGADARIVVLNVIHQRDISATEQLSAFFPGKICLEDYVNALKKDRSEKMKAMIKESFLAEKSRMRIKIELGVPFEQILKAAAAEKVDIIVMANKGRSNLSGILFGSAAEKVFRHSPVPVMSVRDGKKFKRGRIK